MSCTHWYTYYQFYVKFFLINEAVPHSCKPYDHIGFIMLVYIKSLFSIDKGDFLSVKIEVLTVGVPKLFSS